MEHVMSRIFSPAKEKEETEKSEGREEGELIELYPKGGLMVIHSDKSSDKDKEKSAERILPSQHELFEDILEEMTTVRIDTEAEELQGVKEELARDEQRNTIFSESLRIALHTLQRLEARVQAAEIGEQREERRKLILNEEKKIYFFLQWEPQQGVIGEKEEE